ncbi:hypothetical protein D0860_00615 [Hortaea werneckii]|uniref:Peptidase S33 tripeptidyl aminopeptidase-like C-terminal domain-containing protein n=1 Tax=Hortaea werneckii TaxID=91943 RepID=A0A3M7HV38_HORWE|nr:hypothetical protein D0860_00615 [Hortaea werneckii]
MEKRNSTAQLAPWQQPKSLTKILNTMYLTIALVLILGIITYPKLPPITHQKSDDVPHIAVGQAKRAFQWSNINPSSRLEYHHCYVDLQCARLELPMDFSRPDTSPKIALAVIRRPAKVPVTSEHYGGAVITNPGGPGGSGVQQQLMMGEYIQKIVDSERSPPDSGPNDLYFDRWNLQVEAEGILGSPLNSLRFNWRRATALAQGCSEMLLSNNSRSLGEHINTTAVAVDMMSLIERHGEWREQETRRVLSKNSLCGPSALEEKAQILSRSAWKRGKEQIMYWGFSYGTALGTLFASMYPGRIDRMVLDGVLDADDYFPGSWLASLADTDTILGRFFLYCYQAGRDSCPFWHEGGPQAIHEAYEELLTQISNDPVAAPGTRSRGPEVINWTDLKLLVKDALYSPLKNFPIMATLMEELARGNGSQFADYKNKFRKDLCSSPHLCDDPFSQECILPGWSAYDALPAILCTDASDTGSFTMDDFEQYWQVLRNQSQATGDYWAATRLTCAAWQAKAKHRFNGPFAGNTSHPILFIGNMYDTVTPIQNAHKMTTRFSGSGLLQQNSERHSSFTGPSVCTAKAVRAYFQSGALPPSGTTCDPDALPFFGFNASLESRSESDTALLRTVIDASERFEVIPPAALYHA